MVNKKANAEKGRKGTFALYLNATTFNLVEKARYALNMNRSEFIRYCILHLLDESQALRSQLKEGFLKDMSDTGQQEGGKDD